MEDKEIEPILKEINDDSLQAEDFFKDSLVVSIIDAEKAIKKAYSLGQSRMKQKAIDCVPEEKKFRADLLELPEFNQIKDAFFEKDLAKIEWCWKQYKSDDFNDCREQTLKALSEIEI